MVILYKVGNLDILVNPIATWRFSDASRYNNEVIKEINMANGAIINTNEQIATKRVAVKPSTWEALSNLKKPGETFDELLMSLIIAEQRHRLIHDLDVADAEPSIPWKEASKRLGL